MNLEKAINGKIYPSYLYKIVLLSLVKLDNAILFKVPLKSLFVKEVGVSHPN